MHRALVVQGALLVLLGTVVATAVPTAAVEGFVDTQPPAQLDGSLDARIANPTLWLHDAGVGDPPAPLLIDADHVEVTRKVLTIETVQAGNYSYEPPQDRTETDRFEVENPHIEIAGLGHDADVLFGPRDGSTLVAQAGGTQTSFGLTGKTDGILLRDGYRQMHNIEQNDGGTFSYTYERARPMVGLSGVPSIQLAGGAHGYVWDAQVIIQNGTGETVATYDTGAEIRSSNMGLTQTEHYEYVTFEFTGVTATLGLSGIQTELLAPGIRAHLDGQATLPEPQGTLTDQDGVYETDDRSSLVLEGNLTLAVTPSGSTSDPGLLTVGVTGALASINVAETPIGGSLSPATVVAAGAGGATLLGLAAWYVFSIKGMTLAIPFAAARGERRAPRQTPKPAPTEPNELLFDPDRFTLYHLIRSRVGLSGEECRDLTGIEDARSQLDLLVEHGLLYIMAENPRRYCVPGTVEDERVESIAFLRRPEAHRLAELLAVHGLTPEEQLVERARRSPGPLSAGRVPELIQEFVRLGLVYREQGEEGHVVDPADELFACFERMGESAVPKVS